MIFHGSVLGGKPNKKSLISVISSIIIYRPIFIGELIDFNIFNNLNNYFIMKFDFCTDSYLLLYFFYFT